MSRADESLRQLPQTPARDYKLDVLHAKLRLYQATTILALTAAALLFLGV